ncbi:MAG: hypothetical protein KC731_25185 [Myxococcales bacterium]|nr:hypothetical protein [Myxococcales bacterium]
MDPRLTVVEGLMKALEGRAAADGFRSVLEGRIRQLGADMVDGQVLPRAEADALRHSIGEVVRDVAVPALAQKDPQGGLKLLEMMQIYGWPVPSGAKERLESALVARYPAPAPAAWPEVDELQRWATAHPDSCRLASGARSVAFAVKLREVEGVRLPEELLALYAAIGELDFACVSEPTTPAFALIAGSSLDVLDASGRIPRRAAVFGGLDGEYLSIYLDGKRRPWVVFDHDDEPVSRAPLDLRAILAFGLRRAAAPSSDALIEGDLSWDAFFGAP